MWVRESEYKPKYNSVGVDQRYVIIGGNILIANKTEHSWLTDAFNNLYGGCGLRTCSPDYVWDSDIKLKFIE